MTVDQVLQMIHGAGLRATHPRIAVLSAVSGHPHADTDSIIGAVRRVLPGVSHWTPWQAPDELAEAIVERVRSSPGR